MNTKAWAEFVLILVVMEDGLWQGWEGVNLSGRDSLNPCCNGRWSLTVWYFSKTSFRGDLCLNPCCNGRWSLTSVCPCLAWRNCLNPCCNGRWSLTIWHTQIRHLCVLILVVMEDGLWPPQACINYALNLSLNPCCNGRWSLTLQNITNLWFRRFGLNPCCNGRWSLTLKWWARMKKASLNPCCNGRWSLTGHYDVRRALESS